MKLFLFKAGFWMWNDIDKFAHAMRKEALSCSSSFICHYFLPVTISSLNAGHHSKKGMISFRNLQQNGACDAPTLDRFLQQNSTICSKSGFWVFFPLKGHSRDQGKIWKKNNGINLSPVLCSLKRCSMIYWKSRWMYNIIKQS